MKKNVKAKSKIKQFEMAIAIIIALLLILYTTLQNKDKLSENVSSETTQSNIIKNSNINRDNIPQYSGEIVISINNDVPYFEDKDITTENFEVYSTLDEFNRAGVAFANICKYTMPPEGTKRGSISYKPLDGFNIYMEKTIANIYMRDVI